MVLGWFPPLKCAYPMAVGAHQIAFSRLYKYPFNAAAHGCLTQLESFIHTGAMVKIHHVRRILDTTILTRLVFQAVQKLTPLGSLFLVISLFACGHKSRTHIRSGNVRVSLVKREMHHLNRRSIISTNQFQPSKLKHQTLLTGVQVSLNNRTLQRGRIDFQE